MDDSQPISRSSAGRSNGCRLAIAGARAALAATLLLAAWAAPGPAAATPPSAAPAPQTSAAPAPQNGASSEPGRASRWDARRIQKKAQEAARQDSSSFGFIARLVAPEALHEYYSETGNGGLGVVLGGRESGHGIQGGVRFSLLSLGKPLASITAPNRADILFRGIASPYGYRAGLADLRVRNLFGSSLSLGIEGAYERRLHDDFYGFGPDSQPASPIAFGLTASRIGASLTWSGAAGLRIGGGVDVVDYDQGPPDNGDDAFPEGPPVAGGPGLAETSHFLRERAWVVLDRRDNPRNPHRGAYLSAALDNYDDLDLGVHDFRRFAVEGRHYLPFLNELRGIAVRGLVELTSVGDGGSIPFYLLPSLGGPDDMRAFPAFRFRGGNRLLLQTEYRWEAWRGLEMALFFDTGQVFDEADEIGLDRLRTGYGVGFRFKLQETQLVRIDLAHGNEGFRTHVSLNRIF